jgi:hypothetical protein
MGSETRGMHRNFPGAVEQTAATEGAGPQWRRRRRRRRRHAPQRPRATSPSPASMRSISSCACAVSAGIMLNFSTSRAMASSVRKAVDWGVRVGGWAGAALGASTGGAGRRRPAHNGAPSPPAARRAPTPWALGGPRTWQVWPQPDVAHAEVQQRQQHRDRLLFKPRYIKRQRQGVDVGIERLGKLRGHDQRAVGVVALAHVEQPRQAVGQRAKVLRRRGAGVREARERGLSAAAQRPWGGRKALAGGGGARRGGPAACPGPTPLRVPPGAPNRPNRPT